MGVLDERKPNRGVLGGCLPILLVVLACAGSSAIFMNGQCQGTFDSNLPVHPEAQFVSEDFPFLSTKFRQYYIPQPVAEVQSWFARTVSGARYRDVTQGTRTAWGGSWSVVEADDGVGSLALLYVRCP